MSKINNSSGEYVSPNIERLDIRIEKGFAASIAGGGANNDGVFGAGSGSGIMDGLFDDDGVF